MITCAMVVLICALYLRSLPISFPQLKIQARAIVNDNIRQEISAKIKKDFSRVSEYAKNVLVVEGIKEYKKANKQEFNRKIDAEYTRLKDLYQDPSGQTYLMELDCWHWARYVENTLNNGHPGDKIKGGKPYDMLMLAPAGGQIPWNYFLYYLSAALYKIYSFFDQVPLNTFLFYLPLFFMVLFLAALFCICIYYWGVLAATVTCFVVGTAPIFLPRSCAGWFDMDILNLFLPLIIAFFYLRAHEDILWRARIFWLLLAGSAMGLFSFTWVYWFFILGIIIIYELYYILDLFSEQWQYKMDNSAVIKQRFGVLGIFILFSIISVFMICGKEPFNALYQQITSYFNLNSSQVLSDWANTFSTVGELRKPDMLGIAKGIGPIWIFFASIAAMVGIILNNRQYQQRQRDILFLMVMWFMVMFLVAFKGIRFVMFLIIPMGIFLGWGAQELYLLVTHSKFKKMKWLRYIFAVLIVSSAITLFSNGLSVARAMFPIMDDTLYSALMTIRNTTSKDAVVNSWWDYGDWFKSVSKRAVIFDGQSQDTPRSYWMARVILAPTEKQAIGILRMLNNGGMKAYDLLKQYTNDHIKTVLALSALVNMDPQTGSDTIARMVSNNEDALILWHLLYDDPKEAYFVVDSSLPYKVPAISFLGNWDFAKSYILKYKSSFPPKQITDYLTIVGKDEQTAQMLYHEASLISPANRDKWISQRLYLQTIASGTVKQDMVLFSNGYVYRPSDKAVYAYEPQEGKYLQPKSLFWLSNGKLEEIEYKDSSLDKSVMLIEENNKEPKLLVLDHDLCRSMLVRLFFLKGKGLKHFKLFIDETDQDNTMLVFKINWQGN